MPQLPTRRWHRGIPYHHRPRSGRRSVLSASVTTTASTRCFAAISSCAHRATSTCASPKTPSARVRSVKSRASSLSLSTLNLHLQLPNPRFAAAQQHPRLCPPAPRQTDRPLSGRFQPRAPRQTLTRLADPTPPRLCSETCGVPPPPPPHPHPHPPRRAPRRSAQRCASRHCASNWVVCCMARGWAGRGE